MRVPSNKRKTIIQEFLSCGYPLKSAAGACQTGQKRASFFFKLLWQSLLSVFPLNESTQTHMRRTQLNNCQLNTYEDLLRC